MHTISISISKHYIFNLQSSIAMNDDERVKLCPDGKYRWIYEVNMLKNPTILITVFKVMGMSFTIVAIIVLLIGACSGDVSTLFRNFSWSDLLYVFYFVIFFSVLIVISYLIVAKQNQWKYIVLYEMDDNSVVLKQLPKSVKKAKAIGMLNILAGLVAGSPGSVGRGLLVASHNSLTSSFDSVRKVKPIRRFNVIKVNETFTKNQIYVNNEDFDFVYEYIRSRCPKIK